MLRKIHFSPCFIKWGKCTERGRLPFLHPCLGFSANSVLQAIDSTSGERNRKQRNNFYCNSKKFKAEFPERLLLFTGGWSCLACSPYALYNPGSCNCLKPKNTLPVLWFHYSLGLIATFFFLPKILFSNFCIWNRWIMTSRISIY